MKPEEIEDIGIGTIGYKFMGKMHSHAWRTMPKFFYPPPAMPRLIAICGRAGEKVALEAKIHGYETYYTDWRDLIKDERIDIVDNVTPNYLHHDLCIAAAEAGKHIMCEKPLALNRKQAEEMYEVVKKAGVKHLCSFNDRFFPAIRLAKRLIEESYIGKILQYRAFWVGDWFLDPNFPLVWRLQKRLAGSGVLGDAGSHVLDLARFLVGDIKAVCGMTKTFIKERPLLEDPAKKGKVDVDDAFVALLKFHNGAIGSVEASSVVAGLKNCERVEIHGTEGSIEFNLERLNELQVYSRRDLEDRRGYKTILVTEKVHPYMEHWWPPGHCPGYSMSFIHEALHFIDCVVNNKDVAPIGATFHDGLKCQEILDAVLESVEQDRWITLPP